MADGTCPKCGKESGIPACPNCGNPSLRPVKVVGNFYLTCSRCDMSYTHVDCPHCARLDMIVSWNMKHLANPSKVARINAVNRQSGWPLIRIHTPQEVLGL